MQDTNDNEERAEYERMQREGFFDGAGLGGGAGEARARRHAGQL